MHHSGGVGCMARITGMTNAGKVSTSGALMDVVGSWFHTGMRRSQDKVVGLWVL